MEREPALIDKQQNYSLTHKSAPHSHDACIKKPTWIQMPCCAKGKSCLGVSVEPLEGATPAEVGLVPSRAQSHGLVRVGQSFLIPVFRKTVLYSPQSCASVY